MFTFSVTLGHVVEIVRMNEVVHLDATLLFAREAEDGACARKPFIFITEYFERLQGFQLLICKIF